MPPEDITSTIESKQVARTASYMEWNNAIWSHFFNPTNEHQPVTLALDNEELVQIAETLGVLGTSAQSALFAVIREIARPGAKEVFGWWTSDPERTGLFQNSLEFVPPSYIALLGACVLVASMMGDSTMGYDKFSYWPHFNNLVLGIDSTKSPDDAGNLDRLWRHLKRYLLDVCEGKLGLLSIQLVTEFTHINFPISQVILRSVDRAALRSYFEHRYPRQVSPSRSDLYLNLRSDATGHTYHFSPVFGRMILRHQSDDAQAKALEEEVWLTYQHWARTRTLVSAHSPETSARPKIAEASDRIVEIQARKHPPGYQGSSQVMDQREAVPWRLKFFPIERRIVVEVLATAVPNPEAFEQPTNDGWSQVGDLRVSSDVLRNGVGVAVGSIEYFFPIRLPLVFEETVNGWLQRDWLPVNKRICIVVDSDSGPELWDFASRADVAANEVQLSDELAGIDCVRFRLESAAFGDSLPSFLRDIPPEMVGPIQLTGGLLIGTSTYFKFAPPSIALEAGSVGGEIYLNGTRLAVDAVPGAPIRLPATLCKIGTNIVRVGSRNADFQAAVSSAQELDAEAGVGFAISRLFGTVKTERDAGAIKEKYLRGIKGLVVIGPYLLPDLDY